MRTKLQNRTLTALGIISFAIVLGCGGGGGGATPSQPTTLLFASNESGSFYQVHQLELNGGPATQLTTDSPTKFNPILLEDGSIIYHGNAIGNFEVFQFDPATDTTTNLTNHGGSDRLMDYSTATGKILFRSNRDGTEELFTMNTDGTSVTQITTLDSDVENAHYSDDGSKIVYLSRQGDWYIRACNADGTNNLAISGNDGSYTNPRISPDGTKVAYEFYNTTTNDSSIGIRNIDGTNIRILIDDAFEDLLPQWSPNGSKIVFARQDISNNRNIIIANVDGTGLTSLTNDTLYNNLPQFSKDGSKVIFVIGESTGQDIATVDVNGTNKDVIHNTTATILSIRPF